MKEAGYKPNNGLDDQRLALRLVKHHIAGFGGDPESVTFMGESAGGSMLTPSTALLQGRANMTLPASGCFHLHSEEPLFHQLISISGTSLLLARRPEHIQRSFDRVTEIFGIKDSFPHEQIQQLLQAPMSELRAKVGRQIPLGPMVDGDMVHETTTYQALADPSDFKKIFPGTSHCKRILVGDCQMDVSHSTSFS